MYKSYIVAKSRSNYKRVPGDKEKNDVGSCRFCEMLKNGDGLVLTTKDMFVVINQYPYNAGHIMILPKKHVKDTRELSHEELKGLYNLVNKMMDVIEKTYTVHGFNIGLNIGDIAGATYEHLHVQVVPRWTGDVGFMESTSNTKILKESPEDTVRKLKETIKRERIVIE